MSTLLQQLANECFRAGRPLDELVTELVEGLYNDSLNKAKALVRAGQRLDAVRDALMADGSLPPKTATSIAYTAEHQVATEIANEEQLRRATATAQHLYGNGCRVDDVVNNLKSQGCAPDFAERVARENQHHYR